MISPNASITIKILVSSGERDVYGKPITTSKLLKKNVLWAWGASSAERNIQYDTKKIIASIYSFDDLSVISESSIISHNGIDYRPVSKPLKWDAPYSFFEAKSGWVLEVERNS